MKQLTIIGILIMALASPAWGSEDVPKALIEGAKKEGKLVWWGTDGPPLAATILTAFNRRYPFIKVEYTKGIGPDFGDRLMMEADAGASSVDIVNGADSFLNQLVERGVLKNVSNLPFMKLWPKGTVDPKGNWFGMNATYWILAYNNKLMSAAEAPKTYEEIANPKWKGQFAIDERPDHWFLGLWIAWVKEKATVTLQRVLANKPFIGKGYTATAELLAAGQFKFALPMQDYKIVQMRGQKAPIDWVPMRPTEITFQGGHLMKKAPHPHAAELFLRWLTSKEGQLVYGKVTAKASLHPELKAAAPLPMPKGLEVVYRTAESYQLMPAVQETYNRLVHGI